MPLRTMSLATIEALIAVRVTAALAGCESLRQQSQEQGENSRGNGENPRPCNYKDFLSCKPNSFFGTGGVIELTCWFEKTESVFATSSCTEECKVKFAACTFMDSALAWWNGHVQAMGLPAANTLTWEELKVMLLKEYCPRGEIQKLVQEFLNLTMKDSEIQAYTTRFTELAGLCPGMVNPEYKKVERYIWGLAPHIQSWVTAANPTTFESAKALAIRHTDESIRQRAMVQMAESPREENNKRKSWTPTTSHKKQKVITAFAAMTTTNTVPSRPYKGTLPKCNRCSFHHIGKCGKLFCTKCNKEGHKVRVCRGPASGPARGNNAGAGKACYGCGDIGHFKRDCPKAAGMTNGPVFAMGTEED